VNEFGFFDYSSSKPDKYFGINQEHHYPDSHKKNRQRYFFTQPVEKAVMCAQKQGTHDNRGYGIDHCIGSNVSASRLLHYYYSKEYTNRKPLIKEGKKRFIPIYKQVNMRLLSHY